MTKTLARSTDLTHERTHNSHLRASAFGRLGPTNTHAAGRAPSSTNGLPFDGLLTNKILTGLPGEDFARLLAHLEPVSLAQGTNLYPFAEPVYFAYFPETAVLSQIYALEDGSSAEAAVVGCEGLVGLSAAFGSPAPPHSTVVTVGGSAMRLRADTLRQEFARGGAMQRLLLVYTGERVAHISQRAVCNGRHTVERRMCSWLLMLQDRAGEELLPLTHEQIAAHLGARRAGVTNTATALRDKGVVGYTRGHIRILDRPALEAFACECYRVLRRDACAPARS